MRAYKEQYIKEFIGLVKKYPGHEVIVMVNNDTVNDDYQYSTGSIDESRVDKYTYYGDETFFKSHESYLRDTLEDDNVCLFEEDDEQGLEDEVNNILKTLTWKDCIVLNIELP